MALKEGELRSKLPTILSATDFILYSKPGAAAMAAWFSNQTIGLHSAGYGMLLGEATFTSARVTTSSLFPFSSS